MRAVAFWLVGFALLVFEATTGLFIQDGWTRFAVNVVIAFFVLLSFVADPVISAFSKNKDSQAMPPDQAKRRKMIIAAGLSAGIVVALCLIISFYLMH